MFVEIPNKNEYKYLIKNKIRGIKLFLYFCIYEMGKFT